MSKRASVRKAAAVAKEEEGSARKKGRTEEEEKVEMESNDEGNDSSSDFDFDDEALENLKQLLQIDVDSPEYSKPEDFEERFKKISEVLLNDAVIYIKRQPFRLTEIEFYFQAPNSHPDYYTHCDKQQMQWGTWYIHKTGNNYRSGTYKGMDITFGNEAKSVYGGILMRAMKSLTSSAFFEGPCVCVDNIMKILKVDKMPDLAAQLEKNSLSIFTKDPKNTALFIAFPRGVNPAGTKSIASFFTPVSTSSSPTKTKPAPQTVYFSPRVGLTLKKSSGGNHKNPIGSSSSTSGVTSAQEYWLFKNFRAITGLEKVRKGKHYIVVSLYHVYGKTNSEIATLTKTTVAAVDKLINLFESGKKLSVSKFVDQKLTPEDTCQLWGAIVAAAESPKESS